MACACAQLEDARRELEQLLPSLPAQEKPGSLLATLVRAPTLTCLQDAQFLRRDSSLAWLCMQPTPLGTLHYLGRVKTPGLASRGSVQVYTLFRV